MTSVLGYEPKEGTVEGVGLGHYVLAVLRGEIKPGNIVALLSSALAPESGVACFKVDPNPHKEYSPLNGTLDWKSLIDNTFVSSFDTIRESIYWRKIAPEAAKLYI